MTEPDAGRERNQVIAGSGLGVAEDWEAALGTALASALAPLDGEPPDLLLLFASEAFSGDYPAMLRLAAERSDAREIAGCSGQGVIGAGQEVEDEAGISALALRVPSGSFLSVRWVAPEEVERASGGAVIAAASGEGWPAWLGLKPGASTGWLVVADPFSTPVEQLIAGLCSAYPEAPLVGGLASGRPGRRITHVFHGSRVLERGAVLIGLTGRVALHPVVSQGCEPIGSPWTITGVRGHVIQTIGNRPALEVLVETLQALAEAERTRAARNLLIGLAMDEYRDQFGRGDFLIRNLIGVDRESGAITVGAQPRLGQTLQFQVRDARAADEELRRLLQRSVEEVGRPPAALLFSCNGRGTGLFGVGDHDAALARDLLGGPPLAGFFCNGEVGPVGRQTFLHGFTASLGLIVAKDES